MPQAARSGRRPLLARDATPIWIPAAPSKHQLRILLSVCATPFQRHLRNAINLKATSSEMGGMRSRTVVPRVIHTEKLMRQPIQSPRGSTCAAAAAALIVGLGPMAGARANDGPAVRVSGYGTLGVAHSSERNADVVSKNTQPSGAGYTRSWSFDPDTKLGLQLDARLNGQISGSVQALMRQQYDNSYTPELMMGFARWQSASGVSARAGRLLFPVFLISDYREVGYSQTTVRAPIDLYALFSPHHFDGADITGTTHFGDATVQAKVFGGSSKTKLSKDSTMKLDAVAGMSLLGEVGDLSVRAAYMTTKVTLANAALDNALLAIRYGVPAGGLFPGSPPIPGSPDLADKGQIRNARATYTSLGGTYDPGSWFVTTEAASTSTTGYNPPARMGYVIGGVRLGAWTPYASVSRLFVKSEAPTGNPILDVLVATSVGTGRTTTALGLRWDAVKNVAVKAQYDHVKLGSGSSGALTNIQPGFRPGGSYGVFSAAVDFVF